MDNQSEEFGLKWHFERFRTREATRVHGVQKLVNLAITMAQQQSLHTLYEQRVIAALYLPTTKEVMLALSQILADLSPQPEVA